MSLIRTLSEVIARPEPAKRASSLLDAALWRGLLGLAILFLLLAFWRVLEHSVGPILAPLTMAFALSIVAAVLAYTEARRRRRLREAPSAPLAPLLATVLEIAFAPKIVRWFALGSLVYDNFVAKTGPLAPSSGRHSHRRHHV